MKVVENKKESKKPTVDWSVNGLGKALTEFKAEHQEVMNQIGVFMNQVMEDQKQLRSTYDYLFSQVLKSLDLKEINEIDFSNEDFEKRFSQLVGNYFYDSEVKQTVKVNLLTKGYRAAGAEPIENSEDYAFKFENIEKGEIIIEAKDPNEALNKLKDKIRHPIILATTI